MKKIIAAAKGLFKGGLKPIPGSGIVGVIKEIKNIKSLKGAQKIETIFKFVSYILVAILILLVAFKGLDQEWAKSIIDSLLG